MKKNSNRRFVFLIVLIVIFIYSFIGSKGEVVENLDVPIALGADLDENGGYRLSVSTYIFGSDGYIASRTIGGKGNNLGEARQDRQRKANKRYLSGVERLYIISESYAQYGINNIIDILLNNPTINDRGITLVCKGNAKDLLEYKIGGYAGSGEYIEGMVKRLIYGNFFSNQFTMMDAIVRIDAEGRNMVFPYIELKEEGPEITGFAIFKGDKMVGKTDMKEARIINLLKFNGGKGIITIEKEPKKYINYYAQTKRKVQCYKVDGKYRFVINIELNGTVVSNELYPNLNKDSKAQRKFIKEIEDSIKKDCLEYINKVNCEYKTDILDLGREASGKYGKKTGVDWNKVVCDSVIDVNVKAKIRDEGRGEY